MELSFPTPSLPTLLPNRAPITATTPSPLLLPRSLSSPKPFTSLFKSGFRCRDVRATASEERSTFVSEKFGVSSNDTVVVDKIEEKQAEVVTVEKEEAVVVDGEQSAPEFLNKLDLKLDFDDTYSILVYGAGALVALWLSSAVVGAIDSIPVFPKVMELVGLAYTIWFSYRYLIFKQNREELLVKIEDLRQQIIGTSDD